jgi:hypothetical protein
VGENVGSNIKEIRIGFIYSLKNSKLPFYLSKFIETAEKNNNVEFVCFSPSDINFNLMTVFGTIINADGMSEQETKVPKLIFNFVHHTRLDNIKAMRQLRTSDGCKVINPTNRFNQAVIYDIVRSFPQSDQFLLPFCSLIKESIMQQFKKRGVLYILPERGISRSNSIRVEKASNGLAKISSGIDVFFCAENELYDNLLKMTMGKKYISMEGITLLQRNRLPLEVRVYVQKNEKGHWLPTSAIAKNEIFSCGSIYQDIVDDLNYALYEEAPKKADVILESISRLSVMLCSYLDYYILDMATVMIDFVISDSGSPYFIMFDGCEQRFDKMNDENESMYYFNIFNYMLYVSAKNCYVSDDE